MLLWCMFISLSHSTTGFVARTRFASHTRTMAARVGVAIPPDLALKIASLYNQSDSVKVSVQYRIPISS